MSCPSPFRPILAPTLLGRDGVRRAFTLVAPDRPGLTLDAWIAEHDHGLPDRDRPLTFCMPASEALPPGTLSTGTLPCRGLIGLSAPTGCLFAVFGYSVPPHARLLVVREIGRAHVCTPVTNAH